MKVIKKQIPIYYGYLRIVICKDFSKAVKKLNIDTQGVNVENYGSFVSTLGGEQPQYTIFLKRDISNDLIAHECVHLTNAVFIQAHIELDKNNDEPQAYLTAWFVKQVHKALKH